MSKLKRFLDRREAGIAKGDAKNDGAEKKETTTISKTIINPNIGFVVVEEEVEKEAISLDLTDDEFWDISNTFNLQVKNSKEPIEILLQRILENYTPLKIKQFAKRYGELNK